MKAKTKFRCRHCNKEYDLITGALGCMCQNKIKWNAPSNKNRFLLASPFYKIVKKKKIYKNKL